MPTSFFVTFSLTHWMDTLSSTCFHFVLPFFPRKWRSNDISSKVYTSAFETSVSLSTFETSVIFFRSLHIDFQYFSGHVTAYLLSIIGIFQISHWISIFRPTEMGGQVTQHVNFLQVYKFQKPLSFWTELLNHYSKKNKDYLKRTLVILATPGTSVIPEISLRSKTW